MTNEELSKLIREFLPYPSKDQHYGLRSFAKIVATAEREACAKVCDELAADAAKEQDFHALFAAESCADAIRERGQDEMP